MIIASRGDYDWSDLDVFARRTPVRGVQAGVERRSAVEGSRLDPLITLGSRAFQAAVC